MHAGLGSVHIGATIFKCLGRTLLLHKGEGLKELSQTLVVPSLQNSSSETEGSYWVCLHYGKSYHFLNLPNRTCV